MITRLHLGCGRRKQPDAIGVDIHPASDADVIADLNQFPYPFAPNSFEEIICEHILEHLLDLIAVVDEIYRIARPNARLIVEVPHFSSVFYYQDPTHHHAFTSRTFDYFIPGTQVYAFGYSSSRLELIRGEFPPPQDAGFVKRGFFRFINRHLDAYEKRVAFILPRHLLRFELRILK